MRPAFGWPRVLKDTHRIRICLHAGNARAELDGLVDVAFWMGCWEWCVKEQVSKALQTPVAPEEPWRL